MNLLQNVIDAMLGEGAFQFSECDPNIQLLAVIFMFVFVYLALRSMARFFFNLGNRF